MLLCFLFCFCLAPLSAQGLFQLSDTAFSWSMAASEPNTYSIVEIENNSGSDIRLVYEVHIEQPFPSAWSWGIAHNPLFTFSQRSTDTIKLNAQEPLVFFFNFSPNMQSDTGLARIYFYPEGQIQDSLSCFFRLSASPALGHRVLQAASPKAYYRLRASGLEALEAHEPLDIELFSLQGQRLGFWKQCQGQGFLGQDIPPGIYIIRQGQQSFLLPREP